MIAEVGIELREVGGMVEERFHLALEDGLLGGDGVVDRAAHGIRGALVELGLLAFDDHLLVAQGAEREQRENDARCENREEENEGHAFHCR